MSNASERIKEKINKMSFEELNAKTESQDKKTSFGRKIFNLLTWRLKVLAVIFGYDDKDVTQGAGHGGGLAYPRGTRVPPPDPNRAFREGHRLTPTDYIEINRHVDLYRDLVDGRGDHDCNCEHEH